MTQAGYGEHALGLEMRPKRPILQVVVNFVRRKPLGAIGVVIILVMVVVAIVSPLIAPLDPFEIHSDGWFAAPGAKVVTEGGQVRRLYLGGDQLGRDILSRIIHGSRISLYVGIVSVGLGMSAATFLGIISGYLGGKFDLIVQRIVDAFIPFPSIILGLTIVSVLGPSLNNVVFALVFVITPRATRIIRSQVLSLREVTYVDAAKALGCSSMRIMFRHILPNVMATCMIVGTISLGSAITTEASLSFLGVGVPPDVPSWGGMANAAVKQYIELSPWLALFPGIAISLTVFGFNLLGDAMRDVLDPRLRT